MLFQNVLPWILICFCIVYFVHRTINLFWIWIWIWTCAELWSNCFNGMTLTTKKVFTRFDKVPLICFWNASMITDTWWISECSSYGGHVNQTAPMMYVCSDGTYCSVLATDLVNGFRDSHTGKDITPNIFALFYNYDDEFKDNSGYCISVEDVMYHNYIHWIRYNVPINYVLYTYIQPFYCV